MKLPSPCIPLLLLGAVTQPVGQSCPHTVDSIDPTYKGRIRQIEKSDGHEHNLYYYRNPWNADNTYMVGIHSDLQQRNWRVVLYDGDGCFIKPLFTIAEFDWRLVWDRNNPDILYTWRDNALYKYNVTTRSAELLKPFAPLRLKPSGPSLNQAGDSILIITGDGAFRSYRLSDMGNERTFKVDFPPGFIPAWDKARYIGYENYIFVSCHSQDLRPNFVYIYDDAGVLLHRFEGVGGNGHHDFSPDGKWAYFTLWDREKPLEIHVVNIDGSDDRIVYTAPSSQLEYVQNLHISWPNKVDDWFIVSFFPNAQRLPRTYKPLLDEILLIRLDGTGQFLARTETAYSRAGARGGEGDMFWAQPLATPSNDGTRISFNSNRSGTIDQCILFLQPPTP